MASQQLLAAGFELMLIGIGTVFVFLGVLVVLVVGVSSLVRQFEPEPVAPVPAGAPRAAPSADEETAAAITAAIHRHRTRSGQ